MTIKKPKNASNKVFVNIHGAYGESGDKGSKSEILGNILLDLNICNVAFITTSRDWEMYRNLDKDLKYLAFTDKTFSDEVRDVEYSFEKIIKYFGVNSEFYVVANSSGGTVISAIIDKVSNITRLILCNSGIKSNSVDKPILSSIYSPREILKSASEYTGKLLFLQGLDDNIVPIEYQNLLFDAYKSASKKKVTVVGANHNFSTASGRYIDEIVEFFRS